MAWLPNFQVHRVGHCRHNHFYCRGAGGTGIGILRHASIIHLIAGHANLHRKVITFFCGRQHLQALKLLLGHEQGTGVLELQICNVLRPIGQNDGDITARRLARHRHTVCVLQLCPCGNTAKRDRAQTLRIISRSCAAILIGLIRHDRSLQAQRYRRIFRSSDCWQSDITASRASRAIHIRRIRHRLHRHRHRGGHLAAIIGRGDVGEGVGAAVIRIGFVGDFSRTVDRHLSVRWSAMCTLIRHTHPLITAVGAGSEGKAAFFVTTNILFCRHTIIHHLDSKAPRILVAIAISGDEVERQVFECFRPVVDRSHEYKFIAGISRARILDGDREDGLTIHRGSQYVPASSHGVDKRLASRSQLQVFQRSLICYVGKSGIEILTRAVRARVDS